MPFQKGAAWNGNRKGRPPIEDAIGPACRERLPQLLKVIDKLLKSRSPVAQMRAVVFIAAYGYGSPNHRDARESDALTVDIIEILARLQRTTGLPKEKMPLPLATPSTLDAEVIPLKNGTNGHH